MKNSKHITKSIDLLLEEYEKDFVNRLNKTIISLNKKSKAFKYSSIGAMGTCAFYKNGEPISSEDLNKTLKKFYNEWQSIREKYNFYIQWKTIK